MGVLPSSCLYKNSFCNTKVLINIPKKSFFLTFQRTYTNLNIFLNYSFEKIMFQKYFILECMNIFEPLHRAFIMFFKDMNTSQKGVK